MYICIYEYIVNIYTRHAEKHLVNCIATFHTIHEDLLVNANETVSRETDINAKYIGHLDCVSVSTTFPKLSFFDAEILTFTPLATGFSSKNQKLFKTAPRSPR